MLRRIGFFVVTNILIIFTITVLASLLGVGRYVDQSGLNYGALAVLSLMYGMVASFVSLALSRISAKWMMGVKVIDPKNPGQLAPLLNKVYDLSRRAQLPAMPEVGVYESPDVNAFATGPTKSRSLVAVSTGLLQRMNQNEIEGVLAHEIAHIQNGDMVTMTLLQGVINAFVIFVARVITFFVGQALKDSNGRGAIEFLVLIVSQIVLGLLGSVVVNYFSRVREFRADKGSAQLAGRQNMISALEALARIHGAPREAHASIAPFKISGGESHGAMSLLFASHPPLADRIEALKKFTN